MSSLRLLPDSSVFFSIDLFILFVSKPILEILTRRIGWHLAHE
jgi:hypothetical protein